jgi:hypothetical protein
MVHSICRPTWIMAVILTLRMPAREQTSQIWPEVSTFVKLTDQMRFYFLATTVEESRESTEGEFGPNSDFCLKPLARPNRIGLLRPDFIWRSMPSRQARGTGILPRGRSGGIRNELRFSVSIPRWNVQY